MRYLCLLIILIVSTAFGDEGEQELPIIMRSLHGYEATLTGFTPHNLKDYIGTAIVIRDPNGKIVFRDRTSLELERGVNAVWTPSGDFLIVTSVNGEGHSPWRYYVHFFSIRSSRLYSLEPPISSVFINPKIVVQPYNRILLQVGYYQKLPADAMDHPKTITWDLSEDMKPEVKTP